MMYVYICIVLYLCVFIFVLSIFVSRSYDANHHRHECVVKQQTHHSTDQKLKVLRTLVHRPALLDSILGSV